MRQLGLLLAAGGLLLAPVGGADAQQMCSASTAPTVRNPGYPGSAPYSNVTSRVTSNCTGPSVDLSVQPDPYYGQAYAVPGYQSNGPASYVDPVQFTQSTGIGAPAAVGGAPGYAPVGAYNPYAPAPGPYAAGYLPAGQPYGASPYAAAPYAAAYPGAAQPGPYAAYDPYAGSPYGYSPYAASPYAASPYAAGGYAPQAAGPQAAWNPYGPAAPAYGAYPYGPPRY